MATPIAVLTLIQGPAGSGKSQVVSEMLEAGEIDVQADLTAIWAALRGIERGPDGRYPVRTADDPAIQSGLAMYVRAVVVRQGLRQDLRVAVTTGSADTAVQWSEVAAESGAAFSVLTVDPGEAVVRNRLTVNDVLSDECAGAIARWYG